MIFDGCEWDAAKSRRCFRERGFDFAYAERVFTDGEYTTEPSVQAHDEERFISVGAVEGIVLLIVWTPRDTKRRIISARIASRRERHAYFQKLEE